MLIDHAKIHVRGGNGGDGAVSFHTEKYVPNGGPDGGDGGLGGSVILRADENQNTLRDFRYKRKFAAQDGESGGTRNRTGASGEDLILPVPVGTLVRDAETGLVVADLTEHGQQAVVARGGRPGRGNVRFANSVRQAPRFARAGEPGEERDLMVELKMIADVGLVGMPNVGKSTMLSVMSSARPKIANYHFTTLEPSLGVVRVDDNEFVMADIPGLIRGAHEGAGLGLDFLRHVERTRMLLHVVDVSGSEGRDPADDYFQIRDELRQYHAPLADRPQVVAANKCDAAGEDAVAQFTARLREQGDETPVFEVSAVTQQGMQQMFRHIAALLPSLPEPVLFTEDQTDTVLRPLEEKLYDLTVEDGVYRVGGKWITRLVASTRFDDPESLGYFQRLLRRKGVIDALEAAGIQEGDSVDLAGFEFDYFR